MRKKEIFKTEIGKLAISTTKNKFHFQKLLKYNFITWNSDLYKEVKCPYCNNLMFQLLEQKLKILKMF